MYVCKYAYIHVHTTYTYVCTLHIAHMRTHMYTHTHTHMRTDNARTPTRTHGSLKQHNL